MTGKETNKRNGIGRAYDFCLGAALAFLPSYAHAGANPLYQEGGNGDRIALYTLVGGLSLLALAGMRTLYKSHKEEVRERQTRSLNRGYSSRNSSRPSYRSSSQDSRRADDDLLLNTLLINDTTSPLRDNLDNPRKANLLNTLETPDEGKSHKELEAPERSDPTPHHEPSKFESDSGSHHSDYSSGSGFGSSSFDSGSFDSGSCGGGDCGGCGGGGD